MNRQRQMIAALVGISVVFLTQAEEYHHVKPIKNHTKIYEEIQGKDCVNALFQVGMKDQLKVLSDGGCCFKVIDLKGRVGWIEKSMCYKDLGANRSFNFNSVTVNGHIDNPEFINITGYAEPDYDEIRLNRSFAENLKDNVDKETIARMSE